MKKRFSTFKGIILLISSLMLSMNACHENSYYMEIEAFQNELNKEFADPDHSPLLPEDLESFKSLDFFPIDEDFRILAAFKRTPDEVPFEMPTTTDRKPVYVKYGIASFSIDREEYTLSIYQNLDLIKRQGYEDYLFLPFTDVTNGTSTYGGGRYIDLRIPEQPDKLWIDFNKAYNPYCAYSYKYSCPVPPRENDLEFEVKAGVKAFKEH